jgi:hypothetical protein
MEYHLGLVCMESVSGLQVIMQDVYLLLDISFRSTNLISWLAYKTGSTLWNTRVV